MSLAAERAYFDGDPCQHVAAYHEDQRLRRIERQFASARLRWWCGQLDSFGRRVDEHSARIDGSIARVDAALSDYRRIA